MNRYTEFAEAHPALVALVIIPLVTAIFNGITRPRTPEEYGAMNPHFAKFCKLMRAMFPVPQKVIEALRPAMSPAVKRASLAPPGGASIIITEPKDP